MTIKLGITGHYLEAGSQSISSPCTRKMHIRIKSGCKTMIEMDKDIKRDLSSIIHTKWWGIGRNKGESD